MGYEISLTGRTVLITGASSGLGKNFAKACVGAGARVALAARRSSRLEALVAEISAAGGTAVAVAMDVLDAASVEAGFDAAQAALGPIDTVIANAGVSRPGPVIDMPVEAFDETIAVNLRGAFLTAREAGKRMIAGGSRETGRGRVVLIASIAAQTPLAGLVAYCASKAGVSMMGRALAREWVTRGVNVNMICPGYIETEINADWFQSEGGKRQVQGFPRKRLMREDDLNALVLYLCSDASRTITGSVFNIDDGQTG